MFSVERTCKSCGLDHPVSDYYACKTGRNGLHAYCKACHRKKILQSASKRTPRRRLYWSSKANACTKGVEHSITPDDIPLPLTCKYLGIKLDYQRTSERGRLRSYDSPSIDRIDPQKGYIPGNIQVISDLANRMKTNATIEQLLAFAEGIFRVHGRHRLLHLPIK